MGRKNKQARPLNETALERRSRMARERDLAETAKRPLVTAEMAQHGDYEEGWTEIDGRRARVMVNRGGSTVQRWLNAADDNVIGCHEKAAIRYCMALWQSVDCKGPREDITIHELAQCLPVLISSGNGRVNGVVLAGTVPAACHRHFLEPGR